MEEESFRFLSSPTGITTRFLLLSIPVLHLFRVYGTTSPRTSAEYHSVLLSMVPFQGSFMIKYHRFGEK